MGIVVNTNSTAMYSNMYLSRANEGVKESMQKLSSGSRITSAKDDAAGLGISNQLTALRRGLGVAVRNGNDALSISQVAEGAMVEQTEMLLRMRDLALQAANGSNGEEQRLALDAEMQQLQVELTRIADTTTFGTEKLLNGFFEEKAFQVGPNAWEHLSVDIGNASASAMGFKYFKTEQDEITIVGSTNVSEVGGIKNVRTLEVQVDDNTYKIDLEYAMTATELEAKINSIRGISDIEVDLLKGTGTDRANLNAGLEDANEYKQMGMVFNGFTGAGAAGEEMTISFSVYNEKTKKDDTYTFTADMDGVNTAEKFANALATAINLENKDTFVEAKDDKALRGLRAGVVGDDLVLEFRASEKYKLGPKVTDLDGVTGLAFNLQNDYNRYHSSGDPSQFFGVYAGGMTNFEDQEFKKLTALELQDDLVRGSLDELANPAPIAPPSTKSASTAPEYIAFTDSGNAIAADDATLSDGDLFKLTVTIGGKTEDVSGTLSTGGGPLSAALNKALEAHQFKTITGLQQDATGLYYGEDGGKGTVSISMTLELTAQKAGSAAATVTINDLSLSGNASLDLVVGDIARAAPTGAAVIKNSTQSAVSVFDIFDTDTSVPPGPGGNTSSGGIQPNTFVELNQGAGFGVSVSALQDSTNKFIKDDTIDYEFTFKDKNDNTIGTKEFKLVLDDDDVVDGASLATAGERVLKSLNSTVFDSGRYSAKYDDAKGMLTVYGTDPDDQITIEAAIKAVTSASTVDDDIRITFNDAVKARATSTLSTLAGAGAVTSISAMNAVTPQPYRGSNWVGFSVAIDNTNTVTAGDPTNIKMSFEVEDAEGNIHTFEQDDINLAGAVAATNEDTAAAIQAAFATVQSIDTNKTLTELGMDIVADADAFVIGYTQADADSSEIIKVQSMKIEDATNNTMVLTGTDNVTLTGLAGTQSAADTVPSLEYSGAGTGINVGSYVLFDNRKSLEDDFTPANFVLDFDNFKVEEFVSSVAFKIDEPVGRVQEDIELSESLYFNSVASVNIRTFEATQEALVAIDAAMNSISAVRADLGAIQNRVVHTGNNNNNIQVQVAEANSRILDLDYAEESTQLAKVQVLQQTSASMLTQANQITQLAVQLVQG
jgi:flagellin-like hook-associated protein FlgL